MGYPRQRRILPTCLAAPRRAGRLRGYRPLPGARLDGTGTLPPAAHTAGTGAAQRGGWHRPGAGPNHLVGTNSPHWAHRPGMDISDGPNPN